MINIIFIVIFILILLYAILKISSGLIWIFNLLPDFRRKKKDSSKSKSRTKTIAEIKGESFENELRDLILYYFPGSKVKQNIIVRNGKFSKEIDLIALTTKGFFLIEAKNYQHCEIVGDVKEKDWMVKYNENRKYHLYNPIFQLNSGVWNIKKHLPSIYLDKAVVFSDDCKLTKDILSHDNIYTLSSFFVRACRS